ncbi:MAG: flagellar biosynthesis protein FliQ [Syntrophobacteraceae bacterium]|jgi:flagellar biosynthetic protein FliQ|nr:flagellar biosynthesis protein FliQ [Syntrophobacteraceae bacterium]
MTEQMVVYLFREAFYTTLLVSAPMLVLSLVVGLVIAVFQAATSIQEITLTFVPKIIAVAIVAVLTLPWMMEVMVSFTVNVFNQIPGLGR